MRGVAYERAFRDKKFPNLDLIDLPAGFHRWTDKGICRTQMKSRLRDPGYVTLVRDPETKELRGLLHTRMGSVGRLFQSEEWSDPLLFSQHKDDRVLADPQVFFEKIAYHFGLKPHDKVMTTSAQVLHPNIQGGEVFYNMMKSMALKIKPKHAALPILSEIPPHGTAHTLNTTLNERIVLVF